MSNYYLGTNILVTGGCYTHKLHTIASSYVMTLQFKDRTNEVAEVKFDPTPDFPISSYGGSFGTSYHGLSVVMGGKDSQGQCYEFDGETYHQMPSLHVNRSNGKATYVKDKIIVTGGSNDDALNLDSIELLDLKTPNYSNKWLQLDSKLPAKVAGHTLVTLDEKLFLIGGYYSGSKSSDIVWKGDFDNKTNKIQWQRMAYKMHKQRYDHFSFVISNKILTFGGFGDKDDLHDDFVEIIEGEELKIGDQVPFMLSTRDAQAVIDTMGRIIITSEPYGVIVYDVEAGTFKIYGDGFLHNSARGFRKKYFISLLL